MLISTSSGKVQQGVTTVEKTGAALQALVRLVGEANSTVAEIANGASRQRSMLSANEVAMHELDGFTHQHAAMVERAERTGRALGDEVGEIAGSVCRLRLREATRRAA